jgi:2-iminoacetate synthase
MSLLKAGEIQNCCHPNALMTLKEFLMDYATPATRELGEKVILDELNNIPKEKVRQIAKDNLEKIEMGIRDFRF